MDYFFVAPRYTLTIADPDDLIDLILFFGTAILIGLLEWRRSKARLAAESLSQQLQLANADLIRLNREEAMAAQAAIRLARTEQQVATLRESDRYRRELLANVSHDLRTPIATILTRSTAGAGGSEPPEASLGIIADEARRLDDLVRDLLDMTRIESGALELDLEAIRLMEAIEAAAERLQRRSPHRTVVIPDDPRTAGVEVLADWARLGQILDNLLWNADRNTARRARGSNSGSMTRTRNSPACVSSTTAPGWRRSSASISSTASSGATPSAAIRRAPASGWRSCAGWSRRRRGRCRSTHNAPARGPASGSRFR